MSGIEIGGSIIGIFPVVIKALGAYQDSVDVLRLLDDRNFQNEIQAIILEMEIQEVIYRNTYMSLLALFMPPRSVLRLFMSPNGLSQHSGLVTDHLKKHLGPDWKLYMRLLEQLRYSLKMLEANITAIAAMLKPIQFTYTARRRRGLLYQIKENNTAMRILVEQKGSMQSMELVQKHDNVDAPWLFLREKTRHLADLTVSQFDCVTQQYTHSMGIYLDFYRYLTSIGMMYGGVRSGFGSNKEKRIVFKGQTLAWTSKHYAQKKLFMVLFRSVSLYVTFGNHDITSLKGCLCLAPGQLQLN
ncbi:hypothetical protein BDW74DRAFT_177693 [Aspergillus multicolor]|uniref:uncharacterized protein n=1 Tax=Aspergillus multicolor TaxID=41759 RepID=UPI003CCE44C7